MSTRQIGFDILRFAMARIRWGKRRSEVGHGVRLLSKGLDEIVQKGNIGEMKERYGENSEGKIREKIINQTHEI